MKNNILKIINEKYEKYSIGYRRLKTYLRSTMGQERLDHSGPSGQVCLTFSNVKVSVNLAAGARCCSDIEHAARRLWGWRAPARRAGVRRRRRVLLRGGRVVRVGRGVAGPALRADVDADRRHVGPLPPPPPTSPLANAR